MNLLLSGSSTPCGFLLKGLLFLVLSSIIILRKCLQSVVHKRLLLVVRIGLFLLSDCRLLLERFIDDGCGLVGRGHKRFLIMIVNF